MREAVEAHVPGVMPRMPVLDRPQLGSRVRRRVRGASRASCGLAGNEIGHEGRGLEGDVVAPVRGGGDLHASSVIGAGAHGPHHDGGMPVLQPTDDGSRLLSDYHLATLSTVARDGGIHVVAVGFTFVDGVVRIITSDGSQKVRNIERDPRASVGQVAGPQWLSIAGRGEIEREPDAIALAVELYARRYRQPRPNPKRVVIRITPSKMLGSAGVWV